MAERDLDGPLRLGHLLAGAWTALDWLHRCDQLAPGVARDLAGLVVAHWRSGDAEAPRRDAVRLMEAEPDLRPASAWPLPFRDRALAHYEAAMRGAGVSERD